MRRISKFAIAALFIGIVVLIFWKKPAGPERVESKGPSRSPSALAAFGRIEGREETMFLGASADGIVKEVLVTDGQTVNKGALLAVIDCDEIRAEIDLAKAQAESARQVRIRLLRGHRDEERKAAAQQTEAANAVLAEAQDHFGRLDALQPGEVSREVIEQARHDLEVAQANHEKAVAEQSLIDAEPLPEEVSRADAEVAAAEQNVNVVTERLEKCNVRAPVSGTILKVITKAGESYSTLLPHPLFTLADESVRRVRAEVDERDISKVRLGQSSIVTADGFPGQRFEGHVVQISHAMKPKSVLSDDPSQKADRDVLEVTIELNHSKEELPLGLRVSAQMNDATMAVSPGSMGLPRNPSYVPVAPLPEPTPHSSSGTPTKLSGFVLQVGALTQRKNADALTAALRKKGFPAFVLARDGDPYYRVDVGPYPNAAGARIVEDKLKGGGFGTSFVVRPKKNDIFVTLDAAQP
jgi:ABC exporter DevB family membrane fusion protein